MSERIDVLAVMDRYLNTVLPGKLWDGNNPYCNRPGFDGSEYSDDMRALTEARAAVAELVEADKEYDEANLALQTLDAGDFASDEECDAAYDALCDRFDAVLIRRAAALARIAPNELHDKAAELRGRGE